MKELIADLEQLSQQKGRGILLTIFSNGYRIEWVETKAVGVETKEETK